MNMEKNIKKPIFIFFGIVSLGGFIILTINLFNLREIECGKIVVDASGNKYETVLIGDQCWFAKNLATTKYRNRKNIPEARTHLHVSDWNDGTPAYTWVNYKDYEEKEKEYVEKYGYLYNWYAVNYHNVVGDSGYNLCPRGWDVPTHEDWTKLERFVCKDLKNNNCNDYFSNEEKRKGYYGTNEGNSLKSIDFIGIEKGTDDYGFNALPGGLRYSDGAYSPLDFYAAWWSSTGDNENAWIRELYDTESEIGRFLVDAGSGYAIRCIKK
jgi:uncharacterized protein (TIGR02145 family)